MTDAQLPRPGAPGSGSTGADTGTIQAPDIEWAPPVARAGRGPKVGQLTTAWQIMVTVAWAAAFFAFAGVWKASEEIGIATWWLGPRADPQPIIVRVLPFLLAVAVALWVIYNLRGAPWASLAGTAAIALAAAFDLSRSVGLAVAEFAIAGALLLVSVASFGGRYRPAPPAPDGVGVLGGADGAGSVGGVDGADGGGSVGGGGATMPPPSPGSDRAPG